MIPKGFWEAYYTDPRAPKVFLSLGPRDMLKGAAILSYVGAALIFLAAVSPIPFWWGFFAVLAGAGYLLWVVVWTRWYTRKRNAGQAKDAVVEQEDSK